MRRLVFIALLTTLGCADVYKALHADPPVFDNRSKYDRGFFLQVWAETERIACTDIPLDGVTVIIHDDWAEFADACPDIRGWGCSDPYTMHILGAVGTNAIDVGAMVAHQLGHIALSRTDEGFDGRHARADWFGADGIEAKIRSLIETGAIN